MRRNELSHATEYLLEPNQPLRRIRCRVEVAVDVLSFYPRVHQPSALASRGMIRSATDGKGPVPPLTEFENTKGYRQAARSNKTVPCNSKHFFFFLWLWRLHPGQGTREKSPRSGELVAKDELQLEAYESKYRWTPRAGVPTRRACATDIPNQFSREIRL